MIHTLTIIWLIVTIIVFGLFCVLILDGARKYKEKHPKCKLKKSTPGDVIIAFLRVILVCIFPALNFIMMFILIFDYEKIMDMVMKALEENTIEGI